jgi:hypothetical protein
MAVSQPSSELCIAVIAATQEAAEAKFSDTLTRWRGDLNREIARAN